MQIVGHPSIVHFPIVHWHPECNSWSWDKDPSVLCIQDDGGGGNHGNQQEECCSITVPPMFILEIDWT